MLLLTRTFRKSHVEMDFDERLGRQFFVIIHDGSLQSQRLTHSMTMAAAHRPFVRVVFAENVSGLLAGVRGFELLELYGGSSGVDRSPQDQKRGQGQNRNRAHEPDHSSRAARVGECGQDVALNDGG